MDIMYILHFFPNTRAKEEKTPFSKGSKKFAQEQFTETFFWDTRGCTDFEKLKILL